MSDSPAGTPAQSVRNAKAFGWIIVFLLFPCGPFIYLAWLRAMSWGFAIVFAITSAALQMGMVSVLAETNNEPWQPWLVMLLATMYYVVGTLQYLIGRDIWGTNGQRIWRFAGWFFGVMIVAGVALQILAFHLTHAMTT